MKSELFRDRNIRLYVKKNEYKIKILRAVFETLNLPSKIRYKIFFCIVKQHSWGISRKIRNRCLITGRSRGNLFDFKISRLIFRKMAAQGILPGIRKSSW